MKTLQILLCLALMGPRLAAAQAATTPADSGAPTGDRFDTFVRAAILSPGPYLLDLGGAMIDQVSGFPEEWQGGKGFGQRTLARLGSGLASDGIGHGVAALLHHRVLYEPCGCNGGWPRVRHALSRGFVTRRDNGDLGVHTSLFVAKFGAAGLANVWYPKSYTRDDMVREGVVGVGVNAALNIAREFAPELKRLVGLR